MIRHYIVAFASCLGLFACDEAPASVTTTSSAKPASASAENAPAKPSGPVFTTTMMGMERSEPIVEKDLGEMELAGLVIQAPEAAKIESKSGGGFKLVAAGVNYSLTIREGEIDIKGAKETFKLVDEKGELVEDKPDVLIYKRSSGSHLFQASVKVGDKTYTCSTVATASDFSRSEVDQMIESCKSIKKK
jgi:hypothetical protein